VGTCFYFSSASLPVGAFTNLLSSSCPLEAQSLHSRSRSLNLRTQPATSERWRQASKDWRSPKKQSKKDKKGKKDKKKKKGHKKDKKNDKKAKKEEKKAKKKAKKEEKKAKKQAKKEAKKDKKRNKKGGKGKEVLLEDLNYMTPQLISQRLQAIRDLLAQRETSVSRFAPCLILFGTSFSAGSACQLLKTASTHALQSENCWRKYIAAMEQCGRNRSLEQCYKELRPHERSCAEAAMRSHWELRKLRKTSGKEKEIV